MAALKISIQDSMLVWINTLVQAGEYASASDYIRDLIRRDQSKHETIRLALIEGESSGRSSRSVTEIARQAKGRLKHSEAKEFHAWRAARVKEGIEAAETGQFASNAEMERIFSKYEDS